jgi:3-hydroxyisobutyrate dehydrogenase-like beta-hydroxyacid dehydrogenase
MEVGFIGLGNMGVAMAPNLLSRMRGNSYVRFEVRDGETDLSDGIRLAISTVRPE